MGDAPDYEHGQPKPVQNEGPSMHDLVALDLIERKQYGFDKYESLLQAGNGRDFLQDLYEEMQDGIVYLRGALVEQELAARYIKFLLGLVKVYKDRTFPEMTSDPVVITEGTIPGWILAVNKEALGDRYEHIQEVSPGDNGGVSEGSK